MFDLPLGTLIDVLIVVAIWSAGAWVLDQLKSGKGKRPPDEAP